MTDAAISAPTPFLPTHHLDDFDCGVPVLTDWLKKRARKNEAAGASRTYVVCVGDAVVGYYSLAAGAVTHDVWPPSVRRNMPDPIPVMVLGRLAIDRRYQNRGIGQALLRDCLLRILGVAEVVGVRAILVHAISEDARRFYLSRGFMESSVQPMTLCLPVAAIRAALLPP